MHLSSALMSSIYLVLFGDHTCRRLHKQVSVFLRRCISEVTKHRVRASQKRCHFSYVSPTPHKRRANGKWFTDFVNAVTTTVHVTLVQCNLVIALMMQAKRKQLNNETDSWWRPSQLMPATADEKCRRKHLRFLQKYHPRPQASAEDWHPVLPSLASAVRDIMTYICLQLNSR